MSFDHGLMDSTTIFHDRDGNVVELEGDCWPKENIGLIEPTDKQLQEERERDFEVFFFQCSSNSAKRDTNTETNAVKVNVEKDPVFSPTLADIVLPENAVPGNDDVVGLTDYTCRTSTAKSIATPTD